MSFPVQLTMLSPVILLSLYLGSRSSLSSAVGEKIFSIFFTLNTGFSSSLTYTLDTSSIYLPVSSKSDSGSLAMRSSANCVARCILTSTPSFDLSVYLASKVCVLVLEVLFITRLLITFSPDSITIETDGFGLRDLKVISASLFLSLANFIYLIILLYFKTLQNPCRLQLPRFLQALTPVHCLQGL